MRAHGAACIIVIYSPCVCLKCVTESHKTESTIKESSWSRFFGSLAGCLEDLGIYPQIDQTAFVVCKVSNCHSHDPSSQICKPITKSAHFLFYIYLLWDSTVTYGPLFCVIMASLLAYKHLAHSHDPGVIPSQDWKTLERGRIVSKNKKIKYK